jgi:hypothetical protein
MFRSNLQFFQIIIAAHFCAALFGYQKIIKKDWDYKAWFWQYEKLSQSKNKAL